MAQLQHTPETVTEQYAKRVITSMCVKNTDYEGVFTESVADCLIDDIIEELDVSYNTMTDDDVGVFAKLKSDRDTSISNSKYLGIFRFTITEFRGVKETNHGMVIKFSGIRGSDEITFNDTGLSESDGMKYEFSILLPSN